MALVKINGITKEYPEGTTWMEVAGEHQKEYEYDISAGTGKRKAPGAA